MEFQRLTIWLDLGLDDYDEICFLNPDDTEGMYNLDDIIKYGNYETKLAIAKRIAAYEDTGLSPEQVQDIVTANQELKAQVEQLQMQRDAAFTFVDEFIKEIEEVKLHGPHNDKIGAMLDKTAFNEAKKSLKEFLQNPAPAKKWLICVCDDCNLHYAVPSGSEDGNNPCPRCETLEELFEENCEVRAAWENIENTFGEFLHHEPLDAAMLWESMKKIAEAAKLVNRYEDFGSPGYCEHCLVEGSDPEPWTEARERLNEAISDYEHAEQIIAELEGDASNDQQRIREVHIHL